MFGNVYQDEARNKWCCPVNVTGGADVRLECDTLGELLQEMDHLEMRRVVDGQIQITSRVRVTIGGRR